MKALLVRFNASGGVYLFGPAIVVPEADYLTLLLIDKPDRLMVNHANQEKIKGAKVLKEFEIDFQVVEMIIAHKVRFEVLQKLDNSYIEEGNRLLEHLKAAYKLDI